MIDERYVFLAAIIGSIGQASYVIDTVKGKVKPNRVTWFLWTLIPFIALAAEIQKGVGLPALMTFMVGFGPLCVFAASFVNKKSYWKISSLDKFCGLLSVLAVILWIVFNNGNIAILLSIIADAAAGVPTIIKAYKEPETESSSPYLFFALNAFITLLTIKVWDFAHFGFPVYILLLSLLIFALVKFRTGKKSP